MDFNSSGLTLDVICLLLSNHWKILVISFWLHIVSWGLISTLQGWFNSFSQDNLQFDQPSVFHQRSIFHFSCCASFKSLQHCSVDNSYKANTEWGQYECYITKELLLNFCCTDGTKHRNPEGFKMPQLFSLKAYTNTQRSYDVTVNVTIITCV